MSRISRVTGSEVVAALGKQGFSVLRKLRIAITCFGTKMAEAR